MTNIKTCEVFMLQHPIRTAFHINDICLSDYKKLFVWTQELAEKHSSGHLESCFRVAKPQDLHIICDEEIKKGDWCLMWWMIGSEVIKCGNIRDVEAWNKNFNCKKIIASTNKSLNLLPISSSFIHNYVTNYNNGTPNHSATFEMIENWSKETLMMMEGYGDNSNNFKFEPRPVTHLDGSIVLNEVRETESWEELVFDFIDDMEKEKKHFLIPVELEQWLEKNYPNGIKIKNKL